MHVGNCSAYEELDLITASTKIAGAKARCTDASIITVLQLYSFELRDQTTRCSNVDRWTGNREWDLVPRSASRKIDLSFLGKQVTFQTASVPRPNRWGARITAANDAHY